MVTPKELVNHDSDAHGKRRGKETGDQAWRLLPVKKSRMEEGLEDEAFVPKLPSLAELFAVGHEKSISLCEVDLLLPNSPRGGFEDKAIRTVVPVDSISSQLSVPRGGPIEIYKEEALIGHGAYGRVYKYRDISDPTGKKYVAIKKVKIPIEKDGVHPTILREVSLVRQLDRFKHPNIVKFLDVCHGPRQLNDRNLVLFLVFEFVEMDLYKYIISRPSGLTPIQVKDIMFQILCGVDFLHTLRIAHRDLKPQNLLISETGQVKIADFGLAKVYDFTMKLTEVVATLWYRPPEVLLGCPYGLSVDLWSVGCIFAELVLGQALVTGMSEKDQLEEIFDLVGTPSKEDWPQDSPILPTSFRPRPPKLLEDLVPGLDPVGLSLLEQMLVFDHTKRISAQEALRHPYFKNRVIPEINLLLMPTPVFNRTTRIFM